MAADPERGQNGMFENVLGQESRRFQGVVGILRRGSCLVKYTKGIFEN